MARSRKPSEVCAMASSTPTMGFTTTPMTPYPRPNTQPRGPSAAHVFGFCVWIGLSFGGEIDSTLSTVPFDYSPRLAP